MSRNFSSKNNKHANVYTDGACRNNGFDNAKGGIGVYWDANHPNNISEPLTGRQTNNRAEITAATRAINQAADQGYSRITVNTDSDFLVKSATQYMNKWQRNDWTLSDGGPVKNKDDFVKLSDASSRIHVDWNKVPGHSGIEGNVRADALANDGINKQK